MSPPNIALVVGATGIIGSSVVRTLANRQDWLVRALRNSLVPGVRAIDCDLRQPAEAAQALRAAADTTHVFFAAYRPEPQADQEAAVNTAMLAALLDGLKAVGAPCGGSCSTRGPRYTVRTWDAQSPRSPSCVRMP